MKIRQLSYFVHAVRLGSLSAVAKQQGVSVQAVSKAISQLECELAHPLLEREHGGVRPSAYGQELYERAELVVERSEDMEAYIASLDQEERGRILPADCERVRLGLGMAQSTGGERVCSTISKLLGARFGVEVTMTLMNEVECMAGMRAGELDAVAIVGSCTDADVDLMHIGSIQMTVQVRRDHPLAGKRSCTTSDVAPYPIICSGEFPSYRDAVAKAFARYGARATLLDSAQGASMEDDVYGGDAVLLAADAPLYGLMHPTMAKVRFDKATPVSIPVDLVTPRGATSPAVALTRYVTERGIMRTIVSGVR